MLDFEWKQDGQFGETNMVFKLSQGEDDVPVTQESLLGTVRTLFIEDAMDTSR